MKTARLLLYLTGLRAALCWAVSSAPVSSATKPAAVVPPPPVRVGTVPAVLNEASGLAASRRTDGLLWSHNDSGGEPVLYALDETGKLRGQLRLTGEHNIDWEDIASFEFDGRAWLVVADTGDNDAKRHDCSLLVVAEPDPANLSPDHELTATVAWRVPIRYPGGPRDCEAVAVDTREGKFYLLSKRTVPAELYTLPLRPPGGTVVPAATRVGQVTRIPLPDAQQNVLPIPTGRYRAEPTAMSYSPDGSVAVVLTYGDVWLFRRAPGQGWADALSGAPEQLAPHGLLQAEAACFSRDGRAIFVTGELPGASLVRYELPVAKPYITR